MDIRQLEMFVAVADERSFTRAARSVYAAQSTVSAAIRALEAEIGAKLFVRSTRSVELTAVGEAVLVDSRVAIDAADRIRLGAAQSAAGLRGRLRIGYFNSLTPADADLARTIGRFSRDHPLVSLQLIASPEGSTGLLEALERRRLDVTLTGLPEDELTGLDVIRLGCWEFVALVTSEHPLAARETLALSDLVGEEFVDTPADYGNRVIIDRLFSELGVRRNIVAEVPDSGAVPTYVLAGVGIAVAPSVVGAPEGLTAIPIHPTITWQLSAVSARGIARSPAAHELIERLREELPGGGASADGSSR